MRHYRRDDGQLSCWKRERERERERERWRRWTQILLLLVTPQEIKWGAQRYPFNLSMHYFTSTLAQGWCLFSSKSKKRPMACVHVVIVHCAFRPLVDSQTKLILSFVRSLTKDPETQCNKARWFFLIVIPRPRVINCCRQKVDRGWVSRSKSALQVIQPLVIFLELCDLCGLRTSQVAWSRCCRCYSAVISKAVLSSFPGFSSGVIFEVFRPKCSRRVAIDSLKIDERAPKNCSRSS